MERHTSALALPSAAVRVDGGNAYVFVVGSGDKLQRTAVGLGLQDAGWTEIASGLTGGERVVANAVASLNDGATVRLVTQ